ncbi:MAG: hypothetical protein FWG31_00125 [Oscillospiraceae bacterium]|nr:hypothetical protein [Oscillospiraceae bacterium]
MERKGIEGYDERQKALRHKFGYQSFFLLLVLVFLNAFICDMIYEWADSVIASLAVILISGYYFGYRTVLSGAYTGDAVSERRTDILMSVALVIVIGCVFILLPGLVQGHLFLIEDGKATINLLTLSCPAAIIPFSIAYYIKRNKDKHSEKE